MKNLLNVAGPYIDKEIFNVCATIVVIGLVMAFTLALVRYIMDHRLKNKIIDKGITNKMDLPFFQSNATEQSNASIRWMLLLAGVGIGFAIIHYTLPLGFHSLAIMALCIAGSFLANYFFLKKTGH